MPYYRRPNGETYVAAPRDRQMRSDGSWDPVVADPPASTGYTWNGSSWVQTVTADWSTFRISMLSDSGYKRIIGLSAVSNNVLTQQFQIAMAQIHTTGAPNLPVVQALWAQVIAGLVVLQRPTQAEIAAWNTLAQNCHLPLSFNSSGAIVLS